MLTIAYFILGAAIPGIPFLLGTLAIEIAIRFTIGRDVAAQYHEPRSSRIEARSCLGISLD